jgi:hypothetical protein
MRIGKGNAEKERLLKGILMFQRLYNKKEGKGMKYRG